MYLLDTNHCSHLLANDPVLLRRIATTSQPIVTSVIVRGELIFMAEQSDQREPNLRRVESLLQSLEVLAIDDTVADWYGTLKSALLRQFGPKEKAKRRRTTITALGVSDNDLWIAATAKRHDLVVVSGDRDFDRVKAITDLIVEVWWSPPVTGQ